MENTTSDKSQISNAIILAALIIGGAILLKGGGAGLPDLRHLVEMNIAPVTESDHIVGDSNAKVVVIEYSDTECPFCKSFHETMQKILEERGGDVAWVYRHYPILERHPKAEREAEATECAYDQGGDPAFWKYINKLFAITPANNGLPEQEIYNIADYAGLDIDTFEFCLQSRKFKNKIAEQTKSGKDAGATGTPYSLIITGEEMSDKIQKEIWSAVNTPGQPPAVSFNTSDKKIISLNGALPISMVNKILDILLK